MKRNDESRYLLYIEPKKEKKSEFPVEDDLLYALERALEESIKGTSNYGDPDCTGSFRENCAYKGFHVADDGKASSNYDLLLPNGMITNSLASYYLTWYRREVSHADILKLKRLVKWFELPEEVRNSFRDSEALWEMYAQDGEYTSKGIIASMKKLREK